MNWWAIDVASKDVRDLVEECEENLVEPLAAAGEPDYGVLADEHCAAVDLGAGERFDVDETNAGVREELGKLSEVLGRLDGAG